MNEIQYITALFGFGITILSTFGIFMLKSLDTIRNRLNDLCERMAREETKSHFYHGAHDLDKS